MFHRLATILAIVLLGLPLHAESAYELDEMDLLIGGVGGVLLGSSQLIPELERGRTPREEIFWPDREVIREYDGFLDTLGTVTAATALLIPALPLLGEFQSPSTVVTYATMYLEGFMLTAGTKELLKARVSRWRPWTYENSREDEETTNSFPSGHSAYAFFGATFLATTVAKDYRDSEWARPLVLSGYCLAGTTAILRVVSGEHFVTDVLAGAALGSLWGWLVPRLHESRADGAVTVAAHPAGIRFTYAY